MLDLRLILNSFAIFCCVFALWKGGPAERAASVAVMVNIVIGWTGYYVAPGLEATIRLVNDGLTALVLLGITVRYGAVWMGGVMLFYAVQFSMHSFYLVTERAQADYFYGLINNVDYFGIVSCLIIGTIVAWRTRLRRANADAARAAAT